MRSSLIRPDICRAQKSSARLSAIIRQIDGCMRCNDINPPGFSCECTVAVEGATVDAPIALGYSRFVQDLATLDIRTVYDGRAYVVPSPARQEI